MEEFQFYFIPLGGFTQRRDITMDLNNPTPYSVSIGRLMEGNEAPRNSLKFSSKVVSRQHATIWLVDKKLYVQDTKSSSGTFLNSLRLSPQGVESSQIEVHDGDVIKLGEDCEVNGVIHQSIVFKVIFGDNSLQRFETGLMATQDSENMSGYVDYSFDPKVQGIVDVEFEAIWDSLTTGIDNPLKRIQALKRGEHAIKIQNGKILRIIQESASNSSSNSNKRLSVVSSSSGSSGGGGGGVGGGVVGVGKPSSSNKKSDLVTPIHTNQLLNRSNSRGSPSPILGGFHSRGNSVPVASSLSSPAPGSSNLSANSHQSTIHTSPNTTSDYSDNGLVTARPIGKHEHSFSSSMTKLDGGANNSSSSFHGSSASQNPNRLSLSNMQQAGVATTGGGGGGGSNILRKQPSGTSATSIGSTAPLRHSASSSSINSGGGNVSNSSVSAGGANSGGSSQQVKQTSIGFVHRIASPDRLK